MAISDVTPRLARRFADYRAASLKLPLTKANTPVIPTIELPGLILIALSVNK